MVFTKANQKSNCRTQKAYARNVNPTGDSMPNKFTFFNNETKFQQITLKNRKRRT